jgi:hypothetical protein
VIIIVGEGEDINTTDIISLINAGRTYNMTKKVLKIDKY